MKTFRLIGTALLAIAIMSVNLASCSSDSKEEEEPDIPVPPQSSIEEFNQTDMNFTEKAGEQAFSFTANATWTVSIASTSGGSTWCTASPAQGNAGSQTVKITTTENDTYDDRSVTVTLRAGSESKSFVVTQKRKNAILLTSDKFEIGQEGGTFTVEVKANVNYTATIGETCKNWIAEESNTRALSATTKTYSVAANENGEKREGTITFTDGTLSETVHVYQAGGNQPTFTVINVSTAGELPNITERRDFKALKLTGYLNGTDIKAIGEMATTLEYLDISEARIVAGGEPGWHTADDKIGYRMFYGQTKLKQILLPNSVTTIGGDAFFRCGSLTSIDIPDGVTTIESGAFSGCSSLTSIDIPNSVTTIGRCAFNGCSSLTSINIPNSVTTIEYGVFSRCI